MQWLKRKYNATPVPYRFYIFSMAVFISGVLLSLVFGNIVVDAATTVSSAAIIGGFVTWCLPAVHWMRAMWEKPFGKTPVVLLHVLVLIVATVLSRFVVAEALGLPPQTFDMTVGFLALVFYIPAWMVVAAIILTIIGLIMFSASMALMLIELLFQYVATYLKIVGCNLSARKNKNLTIFHSFGAIIAGIFLLSSYTFLTQKYQPWIHSSVRFIAVLSDFQPAINYPGVLPGERVHPLENGFIAFARTQDDKSLIIGIRSQRPDTDVHLLADPLPSIKQMISPLFESLR
ncbi:hypothetical protein HP062_16875 [Pseudomonas sp. B14-6]|uniref:hypothetical protein n=1 Tax=Pseudomonas sp. B14-6 TaxID=2738843 RepID=UPI00155E5475|nr:hypothetical protein [Pseudomonas sp. B14-6]QKG67115.1 hypothetical protein HP062_16875 [Pseudomonas sp. B14-6]